MSCRTARRALSRVDSDTDDALVADDQIVPQAMNQTVDVILVLSDAEIAALGCDEIRE
jgi:hypothetical protein